MPATSRAWVIAAVLVLPAFGSVPALAQEPARLPAGQAIERSRLAPDLEIALEPLSGVAPPTQFTVRNRGLGDADRASLLRVSIRVLPLSDADTSHLARAKADMGRSLWDAPLTVDRLLSYCTLPYEDFEIAVDPLRAGASQVVRAPGGMTGMSAAAAARRIAGRAAEAPRSGGSRIEALALRIGCVYEVRVIVDANRDLREANERNNEAVHRFEQRHDFDFRRYGTCGAPGERCP